MAGGLSGCNTRAWLRLLVVGGGLVFVPVSAQAQMACLPINHIDLKGVSLLPGVELRSRVAPFEGQCLGLAQFDQILEQVTLAYVDAGYVLARAYLPEQNLSDGSLEISVVEGELSGIRVNGKNDAASRRWMEQVFPGQVGHPVHIRRIEQGLDQIRAMPRWQAEFEFDAGDEAGASVLNVTAQTTKPAEFRFSLNNRGDKDSGSWIGGISGDVSNVLGLNETFSFGATNSLTLSPFFALGNGAGDYSRSANADISIPYGDWSFDAGINWSGYHLTIPGALNAIPTDGTTLSYSFNAKQLLHRDQDTKTYLAFDLNRTKTVNRVMGVTVDSSSRVLTSLRATLSHERTIWDGPFVGALFVEHGLKLFGAEDAATQPAGQPNAQYWLAGFSATYSHAIDIPKGSLSWSSTLNGQFSTDRLYGSQRFSIGGSSTVRGTKIALASGSSGVFWRNELDYALGEIAPGFPITPTLYAGLDAGMVLAQPALDVTGGQALGGVVGLKLEHDALSFDLSWQKVLAVSPGLQKPEGLVSVSFNLIF